MFGLGKKRSRLGKWLDEKGISQEWLTRKSGLGRNTVGYLANDEDAAPNTKTIKKILTTLRTVDPNVKSSDFWDM